MEDSNYVVENSGGVYFERARRVLYGILSSDTTVLLFHPDGDGVSAARNMMRALKRRTLPLGSLDDKCWLTDRLYHEVRRFSPNYLVSVDLPLDKKGESLENLLRLKRDFGTQIIVFDHHPVETDLNRYGIAVHVNSHLLGLPFKNPSNYCASALVHDFGVYSGANVLRWVTGFGICGDNCDEYFPEFMSPFFDIESLRKIGRKMGLVGRASDDGPELCLNAVLQSGDSGELLGKRNREAAAFMERAKVLTERIDEHITDFETRKRAIGQDAYLFRFREEYGITSALIGALKGSNPRCFLALLNEADGKASFRTNDSEISARGLALFLKGRLSLDSAGGHDMASGAQIPKDKFDAFEKACIEFLSKT